MYSITFPFTGILPALFGAKKFNLFPAYLTRTLKSTFGSLHWYGLLKLCGSYLSAVATCNGESPE
eukprot:04386.XXX_191230_191424_1 [CDS] Oithona nana genome sequencing.